MDFLIVILDLVNATGPFWAMILLVVLSLLLRQNQTGAMSKAVRDGWMIEAARVDKLSALLETERVSRRNLESQYMLLNNRIADLESRMSETIKENAALKQQAETAERENRELTQTVVGLRSQIEVLDSELEVARAENADLKDRVSELETEIQKLKEGRL